MASMLRPSLGRALWLPQRTRYAVPARVCLLPSSSARPDPVLRSRCSSPAAGVPRLSTLSLYSSSSPSESGHQHQWHKQRRDSSGPLLAPSDGGLAVVLLGWLGAELKHLRKYAEWYNAQGIEALTFVLPTRDLLSWNVIGRVDRHVEGLCSEITGWLRQQEGGHGGLIFHTFSNTGWLVYGQLLGIFRERDKHVLGAIRGCVVDSGPAAELSPQIWASGFATAVLKKRSFSTQPLVGLTDGERALGVRPGKGTKAFHISSFGTPNILQVTRDKALKDWTMEETGRTISRAFGSGYPAGLEVFFVELDLILFFTDPETKAWLQENMNPVFGFPSIVRFSWATCNPLIAEGGVQVFW